MFEHGFPKHWSTLKKFVWLIGSGIIGGASAIWKTVTGSIIHITDALASPMQKCEVTLEPVQAGSGDPSPDNVRPITGWTGCEVNVDGANLFDGQSFAQGLSNYFSYSDGIVTSTNNYFIGWGSQPISGYLPAGVYTFSAQDASNTGLKAEFRFGDDATESSLVLQNNNSFTAQKTITKLTPYRLRFTSNTVGYSAKIQIQSGTKKTDFSLYQGTTLSVTFPALGKNKWNPASDYVKPASYWAWGIPYETSMKVTLIEKDTSVDISGCYFGVSKDGTATNLGWLISNGTINSTTNTYTVQHYIIMYPQSAEVLEKLLARFNIMVAVDDDINAPYEPYTNAVYGGTVDFVSGNLKPYKEYDSYNGETLTGRWMSSMDKYVAGTTPTIGAQVVDLDGFETTVQLTPQEISTLKGENNIWADAGDVEITYKAQA